MHTRHLSTRRRDPRRWGIERLHLLIASLVLVAVTAGGFAQTTPPDDAADRTMTDAWLGEGEPAFTQAEATAWRDAMLPRVEAAAGRSFKQTPSIRLVTRAELIESLTDEVVAALRVIDPSVDVDLAEMQVALEMLGRAPALLGHYSVSRDTVDLPAGNVMPLLQIAGADADAMSKLMPLVVAHELAHALHAQHVDLIEQTAAIRTSGQARAMRATSEGFATLVQARVAEAMGASADNDALLRVMALDNVEDERAALARQHYEEHYGAGYAFFRAQFAEGGTDRVWSILATPPVTYAQIREPATYGQPVEMRLSLPRLYAGIDDMLPEGQWQALDQTVSIEAAVRVFKPLGTDVETSVRENITESHVHMVSDRSGPIPAILAVTALRMEDEAFGPTLLGLYEVLKETEFEQVHRARTQQVGLQVKEGSAHDLEGLDAADSYVHRITLHDPSGAVPPIVMALGAGYRGDAAVQIVSSNAGLDDAQMARVMDMVLDRLHDDSAMVPVEPVDLSDPLVAAIEAVRPFMVEAPWQREDQVVTKAGLNEQVAEDIKGTIAVEASFVRGAGSAFESQEPRKLAALIVVDMGDAEAAQAVGDAISAAAGEQFGQLSAFATPESKASEQRELSEGLAVESHAVTMTLPGQAPTSLAFHVACRDRYVVQLVDTNTAIRDGALDDALVAIFEALP